jgi:hypothetical protein
MTDEQINIAIHEACGWEYKPKNCGGADCCNDLNAMHEAEQMLSESATIYYTDNLYDMAIEIKKKTGKWNPYGLKSRQRAEAFLKTIGKWKETE